MNDGLLPRRYAKALLKFAIEKGEAEHLYGMMKTLAASFEEQPQLQTALANPFVPEDSKRKLLATAAGATAKDSVYDDFITLLLRNNRIAFMRQIALAYIDLYRKANDIYAVDIVTAAPMADAEMKRLKELIAAHLKGAKIEWATSVNPDLIGGFTVSVGSERLDASLQNDLNRLRRQLLGSSKI